MLPKNKIIPKLIICSLMVLFACTAVQAQITPPTWWFGVSGAANFNFYTGTTQRLNNSLIVPTAFHNGNGVRPYGSVLVEYRPNNILGIMLNVGYDGLGAKYNGVVAPCDCPATLSSELSYIVIEPSLRLGFNNMGLYFFAGPSLAVNVGKDFEYTQVKQTNTNADFSSVNQTIFSGQVGVGYDIMLSKATSLTKWSLSPFVSYHPYFGQDPRSIESLSVTTVRAGIALKFGRGHRVVTPLPVVVIPAAAATVTFTVNAPTNVPTQRKISETLPLLNSVFFDAGSDVIPVRYIALTSDQAVSFNESQLQNQETASMSGRSAGQLIVYHNILNILGDRMRANPGAKITLDGSSAQGPKDAKELAETIKQYLVAVFAIDGARIAIEGGFKAHPSSEQPGGTKELEMLHQEDRRVDIETTSPELLVEIGGGMMKPVQITEIQANPLDSQVVFNVDSAAQLVKSWSVDVTDDKGAVQHYGPYTGNQESIPGATILGDSQTGDYKVSLVAEMNSGAIVKKESTVHLIRADNSVQKGYRYSVVFDFDKAKSVAEYNKFLTDIVAPLVLDGSTVIIHGHTDIIGEAGYNQTLSENRAKETQKVIEKAIANSGRDHVTFETYGFGADASHSQFENNLPEERFYNRSVIIDIVPAK